MYFELISFARVWRVAVAALVLSAAAVPARAQASAAFTGGKTVSVTLPDITLKNIGKAKGGITPGELGQHVAGALKAKLAASVNFDKLLQSGSGAAGKAGTAVKGLFK